MTSQKSESSVKVRSTVGHQKQKPGIQQRINLNFLFFFLELIYFKHAQ